MSQLTKEDFDSLKESRNIIHHVSDSDVRSLGFVEILTIMEWILATLSVIMFKKDGTPKSKLQLILSIPSIIAFVKEIISRVKGTTNKKGRTKQTMEEKTHQAIKRAVNRATDDNKD